MMEIHTTNYGTPIHCIICGTQNICCRGNVTPCAHLVYFGMDEGIEFSVAESILNQMDCEEWEQHEIQFEHLKKTLDDEHLCVHVDIPAPSFATYCIIYNLSVDVKDTKDQEKKECPHWTVWGPTLEKYGITKEDV